MKTKKLYRKTLKNIIDSNYGKEVLFYNKNEKRWWNRDLCEHQTDKQMCEWVLNRMINYEE